MSVSLCIEVATLPADVIVDVLDVLLRLDLMLYRTRVVTVAPWGLRWVPDQLVVCDDQRCWFADVSKLQSVDVLMRRGEGSCGPLALAYAAWLTFIGKPAGVVLSPEGRNQWHVVARTQAGVVYDPQEIGGKVA